MSSLGLCLPIKLNPSTQVPPAALQIVACGHYIYIHKSITMPTKFYVVNNFMGITPCVMCVHYNSTLVRYNAVYHDKPLILSGLLSG